MEECDGLLVVGSSLMVYSAFRLARAAATTGAQLALLSVGPTRADDIADIKVDYAMSGTILVIRAAADLVALCSEPRVSLCLESIVSEAPKHQLGSRLAHN